MFEDSVAMVETIGLSEAKSCGWLESQKLLSARRNKSLIGWG
jgi:hypothetical protein